MHFSCLHRHCLPVLGLGLVHSHDHLLPGHILHAVVEIILQDGERLHVIELHLDLHQGKEFCGYFN